MNNLELLLKSKMPDLKKTERRIVHFILAHPSRAASLGIRELSESAGASTASVSRLSSKLGFESFKQFQLALMQSISSRASDEDIELFSRDGPTEIIRKVFMLNKASLEETERLLDKASVVKAARWIAGAQRVVFFGIGGSAATGMDAEIHLSHLGVNACCCSDPYQMIILSTGLGRKDVAVGVSHTGQSRQVVETLARSGRSRARTVAVTNYVDSPLARAADLVLLTSYREKEIRSAKSSSRIAQLAVLDSIYFLVSQMKAGTVKPMVERIEREVKQSIR